MLFLFVCFLHSFSIVTIATMTGTNKLFSNLNLNITLVNKFGESLENNPALLIEGGFVTNFNR